MRLRSNLTVATLLCIAGLVTIGRGDHVERWAPAADTSQGGGM